VKYLKPVQAGDEIIAFAKVEHHGRSLGSVTADLFRTSNPTQKVALASGTFNIYRYKSLQLNRSS
jgi:acyl-coenzyme A thioesterase PaaI-like protein